MGDGMEKNIKIKNKGKKSKGPLCLFTDKYFIQLINDFYL